MKNSIGLVSFILLITYLFILPISLYHHYLGNLPYLYSLLFNGISVVAIFIFILMIFNYKINIIDIFSLLIFILMFIVVLFDFLFYGKSYEVFHANLSVVIRAFTFYIIGRSLTFNKNQYYIVLISFILIAINMFVFLGDSLRLILDFENNGIYLFLGDTFAILSLLLLSNTKNTSLRLLIFLISIFILFIIGSRAALFVYIFVCFLYFFKNISYFKLIWVFSILFISLIVFINYNEIDIENNRMFSVLNNLENDPSQIAREELKEFGVKDISNNIFLGKYANQYYTLNNLGSYMHNIISYYRQFGLVVFILIIFLLIYVTKRHFEYFILNYNKIETYVPYVTLFILIECLFLRSYNTAHFWLIFGLFANYTKGIK